LQDALLLYVLLEELAHKFAIILRVLPHGEESGWNAGQVLVKAWLPKVIHIEHLLQGKDFDIAEQADANRSLLSRVKSAPRGKAK
jgi:hypothetical protein